MNTGLSSFFGVLIASFVPVVAVSQSWTPPRTAAKARLTFKEFGPMAQPRH